MTHRFWKYQGTGNDFVMLNAFHDPLDHSPELARKLCDRHFGIGSDGLIVLEETQDSDFRMVFYNPDGSESFCGNGSRCAVRFALDQKIISGTETLFHSTDGLHQAFVVSRHIELKMHDPQWMHTPYNEEVLQIDDMQLLNTGSPHLVLLLPEGEEVKDVQTQGSRIRYNPVFSKHGVNVNFIRPIHTHSLSVRTYERGVEQETLSCGTGVTASALACHRRLNGHDGQFELEVHTPGGVLMVKFRCKSGAYSEVFLCGPAEPVFAGTIEI